MWATRKAKPRLPQDGLSRGPHRDEATGRHLYPDTNPLTRSTWDARPFLLLLYLPPCVHFLTLSSSQSHPRRRTFSPGAEEISTQLTTLGIVSV